MTVGWQAWKLKDGSGWGLRAFHTGRLKEGDDGNPLVFATKAEAEKARRGLERGLSHTDRDTKDFFRKGVARFR